MNFELFVDPNEEQLVLKHKDNIIRKLSTSLTLLLQALRADDLRREAFIEKGMDGLAVIESATKAENAAAKHAAMFKQPVTEIERNEQLEDDARAARKELRW